MQQNRLCFCRINMSVFASMYSVRGANVFDLYIVAILLCTKINQHIMQSVLCALLKNRPRRVCTSF